MIKINIDGREFEAYSGQTILEVAREHGIEIPTLCYDDRLKIYGGCGLCVVESQAGGRLLRACATQVSPGMIIFTNSPRVISARKMTLEFLLSDHIGDCQGPCTRACPAHTDVQGYVGLIANGEYREAVRLLKERLPIPASIGRVCPHPCETACRRQLVEEPIAIANLKYFVADADLLGPDPYIPEIKPATGKKAAVVGAGPAGLTAAFYLARDGHQVEVFDAMPRGGGMLRYGIPEYRLPKDIVDREIDLISRMGVKFTFNTRIGSDVSLDYLIQEYDAVFLGIGAWQSSAMRCKGEDLPGVIGGIDFLRQAAMNGDVEIGDRVAIVGGGNTAMDAARTAVRLGASEVMVLYRRTRAEMPAEDIEILEAEEEGVIFKYLVAPLEVTAENGKAAAIRLQIMELGEPDASGRRSPVPVDGAEETIPVDTIISAIGQAVKPEGLDGVALSRWGSLAVDEATMATSIPGVFAGGDGVTGPGIAIEAVAQGRKAALAMNLYLRGLDMALAEPYLVEQTGLTPEDFADVSKQARTPMPHLKPVQRRNNFKEVSLGLAELEAQNEARRCLECGCKDYFECQLIYYANQYKVQPERLAGDKRREKISDDHPFIKRNSEKCILCGLCIRICSEVMGVTALGLVGRGFESSVQPEFTLPLKESGCISCGQCVSVCPTGALLENDPIIKNLPMELTETNTVCSFCSIGCGQRVQTRGSMLVRVLPEKGDLLCRKGRFAFEYAGKERVAVPLLRKDGVLVESSWEEALKEAAKKALSITSRHSGDSLAVFISPAYTNQEVQAAVQTARKGLKTGNIASFTPDAGRALAAAFGESGSTSRFEELKATDLIMMVGSFKESPIAAVKIREAACDGAALIIISTEPTLADGEAMLKVKNADSTSFLREILAASVAQGFARERLAAKTCGLDELLAWLQGVEAGADAARVAQIYAAKHNAIIVVDGSSVSPAAVQMLADLALLRGKVASPRNGIIVVGEGANQNGLWLNGVRSNAGQLVQKLGHEALKGVFILGEDPVGAGIIPASVLEKAELSVVLTPYLTSTARAADIVLPGSTGFESSGDMILADWTGKRLNASQNPPGGLTNHHVLERLAGLLEVRLAESSAKGGPQEPGIRYQEGFAREDGRAQFIIPEEAPLFVEAIEADFSLRGFNSKLVKEGLK
ncbi:MAG: FAD-dependent oxidoreductase [Syntrophomonas sp.]